MPSVPPFVSASTIRAAASSGEVVDVSMRMNRALLQLAIAILSDDALRMGAAAREVAVTRFDVNRVVPQYRELYERVIAGEVVGV